MEVDVRKGWSYDMNMTTEQKQIAIAEFEGWKECKYVEGVKLVIGIPPKTWKGNCIFGLHEAWAPPYLTSREAICKAVGKLDDVKLSKYAKHLQEVCYLHCVGVVPDYQRDLRNLAKLTLATPDQMADALLLTLGHQI